MPVLKTKRALAELDAGQDLCVLTDDPHAVEDIELFAKQSACFARNRWRRRDAPRLTKGADAQLLVVIEF